MLRVWQTRTMTIAGVFSAVLIGIALISAKEQSPDDSSKERRIALHATQDPAPQLYFRKIESKEAAEWASDSEAEKNGLQLSPCGNKVYPLDKETVFLFGGLRTPAVSVRSFLLRSGDGGKTWRDVMAPVYGSDVWDMFFLDGSSGWALTLWITEGPGEVNLYSSKDGGMRWRKVSDIPKRDHTGIPGALKFDDEKIGEIEMLYENDVAVLRTKDGGRTWAESHTISIDEYEKRKRETDPSGQDVVQGKDGSQWRLLEKDERLRVLRRMQANGAWKELCAIPMSYGYSKGRIFNSSSSAQKSETEWQKPNSARIQNHPAKLPAGFGGFHKVELSPEANSWAVQILSRGGLSGKGQGDLTITSKGDLVWKTAKSHCNVKLRDDVLQILTQTAFSANASVWVGLTNRLCRDCFVYAIVLQRRESDGIGRTYIAYWDSSTDRNISEELKKVYDTFMTHKGCKQ